MIVTIEILEWKDAPKGIYSSFATDDRCYEVDCVLGELVSDVLITTKELMKNNPGLIDYDISYDDVLEKWIGITCADH